MSTKKCPDGEHRWDGACKCILCGEEEHDFVDNKCLRCGAVIQLESYNVSESAPCNHCMGSGGDYDMAGNSYGSFCPVCGGTGIVTTQVTRQREYIEHKYKK